MSQSVQRAQIRRYASNPINTLLGVAIQTVNMEFECVKATKMIEFGALAVTTVPANDPLLPAWITSIQITINQTEQVVPAMSRADYVAMVQNFEMKELDLITAAGNALFKRFDPALPIGTKVQVQLVLNTLALGTTTPAATCLLTPFINAYDSLAAAQRRLTYYSPMSFMPAVAGVVVNVPIANNLGNYARKEKGIVIITENPVATPVDTWLGTLQLRADGQTVIDLAQPTLKKQYELMSDGEPVPIGWNALICPEGGFEAASNAQLQVVITPYFTIATAIARGYEIFEKAY